MKILLLILTLTTLSANAFYIDLTSMPKGQMITGKMAKYLHKFLPPQNYLNIGNNAIATKLSAKHFKGMKIKLGNEVLEIKCSNAKVSSYIARDYTTHVTYSKDITKCQLVDFPHKFYDKKYTLVQLLSLANTANSFNVKLPYQYKYKSIHYPKSKNSKDWDPCTVPRGPAPGCLK
jgi:hypothetical protein